jgi:hypothetical protein
VLAAEDLGCFGAPLPAPPLKSRPQALAVTLHEMDGYRIQKGLIGGSDETSQLALKRHPDRFLPSGAISDPNDVVGSVRAIRRATSVFPSGTFP